ncbi:uracil phosphoribosyltransferase [Candidatus Pacearchaeota archaeon]|nr:uracil phosphoribosyltransferase [Candidatus Pacearchaeota archaeon]
MINKINNPAIENLLLNLRNPGTNSKNFRESLEKIGEYLGYEISLGLETMEKYILACLEEVAKHRTLKQSPVLITILRAGLPLHRGLQNVFPDSESGFIGAMRDEGTLKSKIYYSAIPDIKDKETIIVDTMLATGGSLIDCAELLKQRNPRSISIVSAMASKEGIDRMIRYDSNIKVTIAAIDPMLNDKGYIVPGLGDAGDRIYGKKS